jgi:hypothetical protein
MNSGTSGRPSLGLIPDALLTNLEIAWAEREEEASQLIAVRYNSTALALRLYSLEIRLKTIICKQLKLSRLPRACRTHDLSELIIFTGMWEELDDPANLVIRQNWDLLADFSKGRLNDQRYLPRGMLGAGEQQRFIDALDDPQDGVLTWLSRHP